MVGERAQLQVNAPASLMVDRGSHRHGENEPLVYLKHMGGALQGRKGMHIG